MPTSVWSKPDQVSVRDLPTRRNSWFLLGLVGVRLRTTGSEMPARLIDPDARSGVVIWLIEVEGGPRLLTRENQFRPADGADLPIVVEADGSGRTPRSS